MLSIDEVKQKALELAQARLGEEIGDVVVKEDQDFEGRNSLRVTILLKSGWRTNPPGSKLNDISSKLNAFLSEHSDPRFAYTHYMTAREFMEGNDRSQSTPKRRSRAG
jgi:hypothetical protein